MFLSVKRIPHPLPPADKPNPKAAQALQEGLGGQFGEMRTMMQYFFQNMNFRGDAKPYQDLLRSIATEEMAHVEQITNTIRASHITLFRNLKYYYCSFGFNNC